MPPRFRWWLFLIVLLAPAILTCVIVLMNPRSDVAVGTAFIGGIGGGIVCGIMAGLAVGKNNGIKALLSILFAAACVVASVGIAMFGCLASGYQLNLH